MREIKTQTRRKLDKKGAQYRAPLRDDKVKLPSAKTSVKSNSTNIKVKTKKVKKPLSELEKTKRQFKSYLEKRNLDSARYFREYGIRKEKDLLSLKALISTAKKDINAPSRLMSGLKRSITAYEKKTGNVVDTEKILKEAYVKQPKYISEAYLKRLTRSVNIAKGQIAKEALPFEGDIVLERFITSIRELYGVTLNPETAEPYVKRLEQIFNEFLNNTKDKRALRQQLNKSMKVVDEEIENLKNALYQNQRKYANMSFDINFSIAKIADALNVDEDELPELLTKEDFSMESVERAIARGLEEELFGI